MVTFLLSRNANPNTSNGFTPLFYAFEHDLIELVDLLFNHGASIDGEDKDGNTVLMKQCSKTGGELGKVKMLVDKYSANVNHRNKAGWTALRNCEACQRTEMSEFLKGHGAVV